MKMDLTAFGKNVKKYRGAAGLTQEDLADKVSCSVKEIGRIEAGKTDPSYSKIVTIANIFKIGFDQLASNDLENRTNYYIQQVFDLTKDLDEYEKSLSIAMLESAIKTIKEFPRR